MPEPLGVLILGAGGLALAAWVFWPDRGLLARWRARRSPAPRVLREDALKHALQSEIEGRPITAHDLAPLLGLPDEKTTSLLAEMQDAGYLAWTGEAVHLTARGREEASRIIRAHRLWERHLADDTGFSEAEWHEIADLEEHRLTPDAAEALARSLGQPARDPHGDPIPTADGALVAHEGQRLSAQAAGTTLRVTHVEDEPAEVYRQIAAAGLAPGVVLRLLEVTPQAVRLQANGDELRLLTTVADNIAVLAVAPEDAQQAPSGQPLYVLRAGQRGRVIGLTPRCRGAERRRMLDLGVLPGTMIEAVMISPGGDPTAYRIRDALIALRREQADLIRVTPLTGSEP